MSSLFDVEPDVTRARTPPGAAYRDAATYARLTERVLARSWQLVADAREIPAAGPPDRGAALPVTFLPGSIDEPLCLVREPAGELGCFGNVCTHRGTVLVEKAATCRTLRCRYHGRQFDLGGKFLAQPGFEKAQGFPSATDDLPRLPLQRLGPLLFTAIDPAVPFDAWTEPLRRRVGFLPIDAMEEDPTAARSYEIAAHWVLYGENYLEGLHVPFVHPVLARALDAVDYRVHTQPWGSLQIGIATRPQDAFDLPPGHPDAGAAVAGFYFWLFPTTMLNFYPWGISVNQILPAGIERTVVRYRTFVWDASRRASGAGTGLDAVEREDDAIVEAVQRGIRSRLYRRGRYAPEAEKGVHHFHRLLAQALADGEPPASR